MPSPRRLAVISAAALLLVIAPATAASANDVSGTSPSSGAKLKSSPGEVQLTFRDLVLFGSASISVSGPGGEVTQGRTHVLGTQVSRSIDSSLTAGSYTVSWSVRSLLSQDQGSYTFSIASKATPKPRPTVSKTVRPTPSPTRSPTPRPTPTVTPTPISTSTSTQIASPSPTVTSTNAHANRAGVEDGGSTPEASVVASPEVQGVGYTGSDHVPSPAVVWGLLMLAVVVGSVIARARRGGR